MKRSITTKLILSYGVIIFLMAGISMSFVSLFSESYIINESKRQLKQYSDRIAITLAAAQIPFGTFGNSVVYYDKYIIRNLLSGIAERNYPIVVFDGNSNVVLSTDYESAYISPEELLKHITPRIGKTEDFIVREENAIYVVYTRPMLTIKGELYATIAVFMQVDRYNIDKLLMALFLVSIIFASFIAVISGLIFSGQLTSNLKKLQRRANLLAKRQFDEPVLVTSNDEVGELAKSIDEMAKSIEEYDKSQKVFLQNASHELRTPLMSIRGYVEGLRDGVFRGNPEEVYDAVLTQASRLERLVEDVLYLSKIETTKDIMQFSTVSTIEIIDESIERVEGIAAANNINLIKDDIVILNVQGDGDHLATVFTNILSNCLRFAKTEVRISAHPVGNGVVFTVTDDGTGISEEDLPYIFERFFKGKKGKHGLGLAIAKAIVLSHKGTIDAYNRKDGKTGAVFEVFLPI